MNLLSIIYTLVVVVSLSACYVFEIEQEVSTELNDFLEQSRSIASNDCSMVNTELISRLKMIETIDPQDIWPSINRSMMIIAFYDTETSMIYVYSEDIEINISSFKHLNCTDSSVVKVFIDPQGKFKDKMGIIVDKSLKNDLILTGIDPERFYIIPMNIFPEQEILERYSSSLEDILIDLALHEQFHLHTVGVAGTQEINIEKVQHSIFKKMDFDEQKRNSEDIENCDSKKFKDFLRLEFKGWKKFFQEKVSNERQFSLELVKRRGDIARDFPNCIRSMREHERKEGTATFFANSHGFFNETHKLNPLDINNPSTFSGNTSYTYLTGYGLSKLLHKLSEEKNIDWQNIVQEGSSLDEVLKLVLSDNL